MVEQFIRHIETEKRYAPLTVRNYRRDIERFVHWCTSEAEPQMQIAPFDAKEVEPLHIREWIVQRTQSGKGRKRGRIGAATVNRELSSLRSFFRFLQQQGTIQKSPMHTIHTIKGAKRLPSFVPESRMRPLIEQQDPCDESPEKSFLKTRNKLIITLFYGCGVRLAELIRIDFSDFSLDFSTLKVLGKGNKERLIPIIEPLRREIRNYISQIERQNICKSEKKALILTLKGERISRITVYRIVKEALAAGGVQGKRSPHVLRHTYATHLLNHGADMREIQELMGHASLRTTQVYTHNSIAQLQKAYLKAHPREEKNGGGPKGK